MMTRRLVPWLMIDVGGEPEEFPCGPAGPVPGQGRKGDCFILEREMECRPALVRLETPGNWFLGGGFGTTIDHADPQSPFLPGQERLLPTQDPQGRFIDDLAERMKWLGWIAIDDLLEARRSQAEIEQVRVVLTRMNGQFPVYLRHRDIPTKEQLESEYFREGRFVFFRISGDATRPAGFVVQERRT